MTNPSPFPDPTITEMIVDRVDLHAEIDGLLREFHQRNAGLRLRPDLRTSWGELKLDIETKLTMVHGSGPLELDVIRDAVFRLRGDMLKAIRPFAKKYPQAHLELVFDYIQDEAQATVNLTF